MTITEKPIIIYLSAIVSAFVGGITAYVILLNTIKSTTQESVAIMVANGEIKGIEGKRGLIGSVGPQGPVGSQGPQGYTGSPGPVGPQGSQGIQGVPGLQGGQGPEGKEGQVGPRGLKGGVGPQGLPGKDLAMPVGTIIASVTIPSDVDQLAENKWVLADGRSVATTSGYYEMTGSRDVPDLRGLFLRGLNEGRSDGKQDPDGADRYPGHFQSHQIQTHTHKYSDLYHENAIMYTRGTLGAGRSGKEAIKNTDNGTGKNFGSETRPANIAVFYYIKIN